MNPEKILSTLLQASAAFESAMRRLNPLIVSEIRRDLLVHLEPLTAVRRFLHDPGATMNNTVQSGLLRTCDFLAAAIKNFGNEEDLQAAFISALRAGRKHCRALEALFPLCHAFPEVNRYFLEEKKESAIRSEPPASTGETGIFHVGANQDLHARGGYSLFIPENDTPKRSRPLIVALHGGYSHGRDFLWTWLREARSRGYVIFAPTSMAMTWSITQAQIDAQQICRHLGEVVSRVNIDQSRILLTGMSDGGTYALKLALSQNSNYQYVAPVACALAPVDLKQAEGKRIFWIHGAQDWIFPVSYAVGAGEKLKRAGADIKMKVIRDLAHAYPREENKNILDCFEKSAVQLS